MKFVAESRNIGDPTPYLQDEGVRVGELMQAGILETILLKSDHSGAYLVLNAEDQATAHAAVSGLPLAANGLTTFILTEVTPV